MLRGAHAIALDSKGRLAVPTKYRAYLDEQCGGRYVCTIDISNRCLLLYPLNKWELLEKKLSSLSSVDENERRLQRLLLGYASDCETDANGRLLIAPVLREYAGLEKNVMLVGQLNRFEIWSDENWKASVSSDLASISASDWNSSPRLREFTLNDSL